MQTAMSGLENKPRWKCIIRKSYTIRKSYWLKEICEIHQSNIMCGSFLYLDSKCKKYEEQPLWQWVLKLTRDTWDI